MEKRFTEEATALFVATYGKTPRECNLTEIGVYEKQRAYLYAHSKEEIVAYRTCQNIIRWIISDIIIFLNKRNCLIKSV